MTSGNGVLVRVSEVDKVFRRGSEEIHVLGGLDLEVPGGEFLALMGPSGSGKTTLLNLIGGLDRPTQGSVDVGGERINTMSERKLAAWRARHVGLVFQFYNLLPVLTIVLFIAQQKMFMPPATDETTAVQHKMMKYMMIFVGLIFFKVASGLCINFIASSLWGLAERQFLPKHAPAQPVQKTEPRADAKARAKAQAASAAKA